MNPKDPNAAIHDNLQQLKLGYIRDNYQSVAKLAARKQWQHVSIWANWWPQRRI